MAQLEPGIWLSSWNRRTHSEKVVPDRESGVVLLGQGCSEVTGIKAHIRTSDVQSSRLDLTDRPVGQMHTRSLLPFAFLDFPYCIGRNPSRLVRARLPARP